MNTMTIILLVLILVSIGFNVALFIYVKKYIKKLRIADKELAKTMIMNFEDHEKLFDEDKKSQNEIKRDNQVIMNELKSVQNAIMILNNGFTIPSAHNS